MFGQACRSRYRSDFGVARGVGAAVGIGVADGVGDGVTEGVGEGVAGADEEDTEEEVGATTGAPDAADGEAAATDEGDGLAETPGGAMSRAPPRARTKPTEALSARTSTTSDPSIAGDIARPSRTTGVGVSAITAAPRR